MTFTEFLVEKFGAPVNHPNPSALLETVTELTKGVTKEQYKPIFMYLAKETIYGGWPSTAQIYKAIDLNRKDREREIPNLAEQLKKERYAKEKREEEDAHEFAFNYLTKTKHGKQILVEGWVREATNRLRQKFLIARRYRQETLDWRTYNFRLEPADLEYIRNYLSFNDHAENWQDVHFQALWRPKDKDGPDWKAMEDFWAEIKSLRREAQPQRKSA